MEAYISRLVPDMSGAPPPADGGDGETTRLLMFDAVDAVLTAISARQPVLVVLDDLHWADAGSLALIRYLLR
ncbi:MAG: AAA family ATPase, partial [Actinomycetia bacterium]|nr:AAA family ATPase [Actinomycetes bacterium]